MKISEHWIIHSVFIVVQLKSTFSSSIDSYHRRRIISSNFIYVKNDIAQIKSYELKKIVNNREIAIKRIKYLIKWKDCGPEQDMWRNLPKMRNVMNMIKEYHRIINVVVLNRYQRSQKTLIKKSITSSSFESFASSEIVLRKLMIVILVIASTSISSPKTFIQFRRFSRFLPSI